MENSEKGVQTVVDIYIYWKFVHSTGRGLAPFRFRKQKKVSRRATSAPRNVVASEDAFIELDGAGGKTARSRASGGQQNVWKVLKNRVAFALLTFRQLSSAFSVSKFSQNASHSTSFSCFFLPSLLSSSPFRPNDGNFFLLFSVLFSPNTQPIGIRCLNYWREKNKMRCEKRLVS